MQTKRSFLYEIYKANGKWRVLPHYVVRNEEKRGYDVNDISDDKFVYDSEIDDNGRWWSAIKKAEFQANKINEERKHEKKNDK